MRRVQLCCVLSPRSLRYAIGWKQLKCKHLNLNNSNIILSTNTNGLIDLLPFYAILRSIPNKLNTILVCIKIY